jgi:hypothetical protein
LIPVLAGISKSKGGRKVFFASAFCCLVITSFWIHYRGATKWETWAWNLEPVDVNSQPARLWDWHDIQFLRGMGTR